MSAVADFEWRPIDPGQVRAWVSLASACAAADDSGEHFGETDLLDFLSDPTVDAARGSVAVYDGSVMVADCALQSASVADQVHDMRVYGGVRPDYRGRGLGSRLLAWAEQAAVRLHRERYADQALALYGGCGSSNVNALALFEANGYHRARSFHAMACDLSAALPAAPVPAGVRVVEFTPDRSADARLIKNEAFLDHWRPTSTSAERWDHEISSAAFRPAYSFLAYAGREPLSVVLGYEYDAATAATGARDLYIGIVATRRPGRGRGVASALLARSLGAARADGFATSSLGVDADSPTGAVGVYQRLGFAVTRTRVVLGKILPPADR